MGKEIDLFEDVGDLSDVFYIPNTSWEIVEEANDSIVDGVHVLARARGPFFLVDGASENGRFYTRSLWEGILKKNKQILSDGMLGAIGHDQPINDKAIREGLLSHKIHKLWIDEDQKIKLKNGQIATVGMGEILVLGSDSGKNLNTYLRTGIKLATSSRASGKYRGKTEFGENIIDEDSFKFITFDVVQNPGITVSQLHIVESKDDNTSDIASITNNTDEEIREMSKELEVALGNITEEKVKIHAKLSEALNEITALKTKISEFNGKIKDFEVIGTSEDIVEMNKELSTYKDIGSIDSIKESYCKIDEMMKAFEVFKDFDNIKSVFAEHADFTEQLENLGTFEDLNTAVVLLESYVKFGTPNDIKETYDKTHAMLDKEERKQVDEAASKLADDKNVKVSVVKTILEALKGDSTETSKILDDIIEGREVTKRYVKDNESKNENSGKHVSSLQKSKLSRLFNTTAK